MKAIYHEEFTPLSEIKSYTTEALAAQYARAVKLGQKAEIDRNYAAAFRSEAASARSLFSELIARLVPATSPHRAALAVISEHGTLAERLIESHGAAEPTRSSLAEVYRQLTARLKDGRPFVPNSSRS